MSDVVAAYRKALRDNVDSNLTDFAAEQDANPVDFSKLTGFGQAPPEPPKTQKPGAIGTGLEVAKKGLHEGWNNLVQALQGIKARPDSRYGSMWSDAQDTLSNASQGVYGAFQILMAAPGGAQEALKVGIENMGGTGTALPGYDKWDGKNLGVAGGIKALFALPMVMDPNFRKNMEDPKYAQAFMDSLVKPMSVGEVLSFAGFLGGLKLQSKVASGVSNRILPPRVMEPPPVKGALTKESLAESAQKWEDNRAADFAGAMGYPATGADINWNPRSVSRDPSTGRMRSVIEEPLDLSDAVGSEKGPVHTAPPREVPPRIPPTAMNPEQLAAHLERLAGGEKKAVTKEDLKASADKAEQVRAAEMKGAFDQQLPDFSAQLKVELERLKAAADKVEANRAADAEGSMAQNVPDPVKELEIKLNELKKSASDAEAKTTADAQGSLDQTITGPEKALEALKEAAKKVDDARVTEMMGAFEDSIIKGETPAKPGETLVETVDRIIQDAEVKQGAKGSELKSDSQENLTQDMGKAVESMETMWDRIIKETGAVADDIWGKLGGSKGDTFHSNPAILARTVVGAVIGGSQGDTPEERLRNGLIGLGMGAFASKAIINKMVDSLRKVAPAIFDSTLGNVPGFKLPEQPIRVIRPSSGGMTFDQLASMPRGVILDATQLREVSHITTQSVMQVFDVAKRIMAGDDIAAGSLRQAMAIARTASTAEKTAYKAADVSPSRSGIEARTAQVTEALNRITKEWDPSRSEMDLANIITSLKGKEQISAFTRYYYATGELMTQTLYGTATSGAALIKNMSGAVMVPVSILDRSFAAMKVWDPARRATFADVQQSFVALWESMREQQQMIKSWQDLGEQATKFGDTHIESRSRGAQALGDLLTESGHDGFAKAINWYGSAIDLAPGTMSRTDGIMKAVHGRIKGRLEAMRIAEEKGLTDQAYWDEVARLDQDHSLFDTKTQAAIKDYRDHMTFTQNLTGRITSALQKGPEDPWLNFAYRLTVSPFIRTPARLMEIGAEYTPGLNALTKNYKNALDAGGVEAEVANARMATGLVSIGTFAYLASQGYITGTAEDRRMDKVMDAAGRPYLSFWDPLSQKYRSYKGMQPLTTIMATGANLANVVARIPEMDAHKLMAAYALTAVHSLDDSPFFNSLAQIHDIIARGTTDTIWDNTVKAIRQRLEIFIPGALREGVKFTDSSKREALPDPELYNSPILRELKLLQDKLLSTVPGVSNDYKPARNRFTGDELAHENWPYNPLTSREANHAEWAKEIQRLDGAGIPHDDQWIGKKVVPNTGVNDIATQPSVMLNWKQQDRLEILRTQVVKDGGKNLVQALDAMVTSDMYKRMPDISRVELIQGVWNNFTTIAEHMLLSEDIPLRAQWESNFRESISQRLPVDNPNAKPLPRRPAKPEVGVR